MLPHWNGIEKSLDCQWLKFIGQGLSKWWGKKIKIKIKKEGALGQILQQDCSLTIHNPCILRTMNVTDILQCQNMKWERCKFAITAFITKDMSGGCEQLHSYEVNQLKTSVHMLTVWSISYGMKIYKTVAINITESWKVEITVLYKLGTCENHRQSTLIGSYEWGKHWFGSTYCIIINYYTYINGGRKRLFLGLILGCQSCLEC